ncbi:Panacea domain-containing protein [Sphingomonas sp. GCM10030256]|uniref:Panacea domain-containing protein n=1 Tax=Sphingomonas sp. GCM10030256 TaxID=3273427 RepID=UPI00360BDEE2
MWCLAITGEPLTGDRPEAWSYGPVYRRLADALARYGTAPVERQVTVAELYPGLPMSDPVEPASSNLDPIAQDILKRVFRDYGTFGAPQLSALLRRNGAPWAEVFADGAGRFRDIPHNLIQAQFVDLAMPPVGTTDQTCSNRSD